jgi:hypothetical protein
VSFDVNKVQELLAEAAAACYQQNGFPQKKGVEASKFAGVTPEKFTDFKQVLSALEETQNNSALEKVKKFSPLAEGVNAALQQMGITKMEVLSNEGATSIVLRGWGKDYPNGCVVRMVDSHAEGKAVNSPVVLQPYESKFINAEGNIDKDPLTATAKRDPVTRADLPSGARIDLVAEVVSLEQATKWLVSNGKLAEEDASRFREEGAYKLFYKALSTEYVSKDQNTANLCVLPNGSVITYDLGSIVENKNPKLYGKMLSMAESIGVSAEEVGSTALQEAAKLANAQKGLATLQKGSSVTPVTPANKTPPKMKM